VLVGLNDAANVRGLLGVMLVSFEVLGDLDIGEIEPLDHRLTLLGV
jgi:hypothetical protein